MFFGEPSTNKTERFRTRIGFGGRSIHFTFGPPERKGSAQQPNPHGVHWNGETKHGFVEWFPERYVGASRGGL